MKIEKINIYKILLPFLGEFSHSLRKRTSVGNIVVEISAGHGEQKGYGEGAPRSYVTGESQETAVHDIEQFIRQDSFPLELDDVGQIWDFVDSLPNGREHNAGICALEMALLDLLARKQNKPVIEYFPQDFFKETISYGAAAPLADRQRIIKICRLIRQFNINKLKLKMDNNFSNNKEIIEAVASVFDNNCDLKIDINGVWDDKLALMHMPLLKKHNVRVLEQPTMNNGPDILKIAEIAKAHGITLMADESACTLRDVETLVKEGNYGIINIRLSKCGGFRRSFRMIDFIRSKEIAFQIGCQLGESGLLSAAGRAINLLCDDSLYYDGSYDSFLLKKNVTLENVSFGPGGVAGPLHGAGLGVEVSKTKLKHLSNYCSTVKL